MKLTLYLLSKLLKIEIKDDNIGEVPYLKLSDKYMLTEHFATKDIEINNLETYEWKTLTSGNVHEVLNILKNLE